MDTLFMSSHGSILAAACSPAQGTSLFLLLRPLGLRTKRRDNFQLAYLQPRRRT